MVFHKVVWLAAKMVVVMVEMSVSEMAGNLAVLKVDCWVVESVGKLECGWVALWDGQMVA